MLEKGNVPFFVPDVGEPAIELVGNTLRSGWLTTGARTAEFEAAFMSYVGAKHAIAVNSCTAALHLALAAHDIGPGDEVIVPTMTFTATAEVVVHLGARPVLADVSPSTLNLSPQAFEAAISPKTRAVIPVHYGGQPANMESILRIARRHGLAVIEDAAHALPASYRGQTIGSIGDVTCFSFYANKTITTGEGGMITTQDETLADRMRSLSLHGLSNDAWDRYTGQGSWDYAVVAAGFKYNLTDIASALGLEQLKRADTFAHERERVSLTYDGMFANSDLIEPLDSSDDVAHAHHLYVVRLNVDAMSQDRNWVIEQLKARGIGTSVHYRPLHMHRYYQQTFGHAPQDFPVAAQAFEQIVSLPIYPLMDEAAAEYVGSSLLDITAAVAR